MAARKRRGGTNLGMTLGLVVGIHLAMGGAVFIIGKTQAGKEIMHKIRFVDEAPPPAEEVEPPKTEPLEPPPVDTPKIEAPKIAEIAAPVAAAGPSAVDIGGSGGGGNNWNGGKFNDRIGSGPMGVFHACVTGRYRSCLGTWNGLEKPAEVEIRLGSSGKIVSSRMSRSSGSAEQDRVLLDALQCAEREFRCTLPSGESGGRVISVKLTPSQGGIRAQ